MGSVARRGDGVEQGRVPEAWSPRRRRAARIGLGPRRVRAGGLGRHTAGRRSRVSPPADRRRAARRSTSRARRSPAASCGTGAPRASSAGSGPTRTRTTRISPADDGRGADARDLGRHRLLVSERQLPSPGVDPAAGGAARAPDGRRVRRRARERADAGSRLPMGQIAANEAQHQSAVAALAGRPLIGKAFAPALQMGPCPTPWTSSRADDGEAAIHGERGGGGAGDQSRHAAPLGPRRPHQGHARQAATGASSRRRRSTACAATARATHISARNRFRGTVTDVQVDGLMAQVEFVVSEPVRLSRSSRGTRSRSSA